MIPLLKQVLVRGGRSLPPDSTLNDIRQRRDLDFIVTSSECTLGFILYMLDMLELQRLVSCLKCLLGLKFGSSTRAARTFNGESHHLSSLRTYFYSVIFHLFIYCIYYVNVQINFSWWILFNKTKIDDSRRVTFLRENSSKNPLKG